MEARSSSLTLAFSGAGHFLTHLMMLLYPTVVLALEGMWGLHYGDLLSLSLAGFVLYGLGALPAGWLGDRWSAEHMMVVYFVGSGGAAIATGFADSPLALAVGLGAIGLFGSIYHPVGTAWMVRNAVSRGRALGWNGIAGSLGMAAAPFLAGALSQLVSWRAAFVVPGAVSVAIGLALLSCMRGGRVVRRAADLRPEPQAARGDIIRVFIVMSVTMLFAGIVGQALTVALPKAFAEGLTGLTQGGTLGAGGFVTIVFLISATGQLLGGRLADTHSMKAIYILSWVAQIPLFWLASRATDFGLLAALGGAAYFGVFAIPAENGLVARYTPSSWRGTAYGAKFVLSLGVSTVGVEMVAVIRDASGNFAELWLVLALCAALVAVAGLFLPGSLRGQTPLALKRREAVPQPAE